MLIWFILFFLVVAISFVLAYQSMGDYEENPLASGKIYSLFLVQKPQALTVEILEKIHAQSISQKAVLSLERIFKGEKQALVLFGPSSILHPYIEDLGLVELEDYSQEEQIGSLAEGNKVLAWEVGMKKKHGTKERVAENHLQEDLPPLLADEQFWWQVILKPQKDKNFQGVIRAVFLTKEQARITQQEEGLLKIGHQAGLLLLPQVYSSSQVLDFYRQRSMSAKGRFGGRVRAEMLLGITEVKALLGL